jgi:SsrA-binding protein
MKKSGKKIVANNRSATYQYSLDTEFEAGIVLQGWEVVAIRQGQVNLSGSYAHMINGEAWLTGCHIAPLKTTTIENTEPERARKLLLNKKELNKLMGATAQKGMSIIALRMYLKAGKIKIAIALAKGKKAHDKRQSIKERDIKRDQQREQKDLR